DNKERVIEKVVMKFAVPVNIDQVTDLGEGEKRNGEGKFNVEAIYLERGDRGEHIANEIGIFVISEQRQVEDYAKSDQVDGEPAPGKAGKPLSDGVVKANGEKQERDILHFPIAVKKEGSGKEP
ncbi:MAG: hypothetical protein JWM04_1605, partial [Verrucomicrobiales bacterium]|nr:hypothetical protein [Verrucomicrobiales bacterium]